MANAGEVKIVLAADTAAYTAALQKGQAQLERFQQASTRAGHATIAPWQASSAAIRVLEGNISNNIRAAERFVAMSPAVARAAIAMFPVVGATALLGVVARLGMEIGKAIEQAQRMARELQNGFASMNNSALLANDELRKSNDLLSNQIAKLEGKPQNSLALSLDEARIAADKLSQSLDADNQKVAELLKTNAVGWKEGLLGQQYQTKGTTGSVNYWDQRLADQGHAYNMAVHEFGAGSGQAKQAQALIDAIRADAQKWVASRIAEVSGWKDQGATTANMNILRGFQAQLNYRQDAESLNADHDRLSAQEQKLQHAKELQASQRQQASQQMEAARQKLDAMKATNTMSLDQEAQYWQKLASSAKRGSDLYTRAMDEANKARAASLKQYQGQWIDQVLDNAKFRDMTPYGAGRFDMAKGDQVGGLQDQAHEAVEYLRSLNEAASIQRANASAAAEMAMRLQFATGQMSRYDAAQVQTAMHAQDFAETMRRLDDAQRTTESMPGPTEVERNLQLQQIANQRSTAIGAFAIQSMQDETQQRAAMSMGALREATDQLTQRFLDLPSKISDLFVGSIEGLNQTFASAVMAPSRNGQEWRRNMSNAFAGEFRGMGSRGLNAALQLGEGSLLKHFGFGGKPDGSQSNPLWVRMASLGAAAGFNGSQLAGSMLQTSNESGGAGGITSTIASIALKALPGFASGGPIPSNMPAIVGERGPELFMPSTSGRIIPSDQLGMGGSGDMHVHVDARRATDPAATEARLHRAMQGYMKQVPSLVVGTIRNYNRLRPGTSHI